MRRKDIDPKIKQVLEGLRSVPQRDPVRAARGKAEFLKQAAGMRLAVSREKENRHNGQSNTIFPAFPRKERAPVFNTLIAIVMAIAVFFGGAATTVYASQTSLPNQPLYPVKLWIEDVTFALHDDPQIQIQYNLDFSDRRITEMTRMLSNGATIPEDVMIRLQNELDQVLQLATGLNDLQMLLQLEKIRQRAENQLQETNTLMAGAPLADQPLLARARARIQEQVQLATLGGSDPVEYRHQIQQRFHIPSGAGEGAPDAGNGPGGTSPTSVPGGNGNGLTGGDSPTGTPSQYGTGAGGDQPTTTPGQYGPGPQSPTSTPQYEDGGNGSSYGNKP
jgi:hypothetical protein